jgi:hypothetical protein
MAGTYQGDLKNLNFGQAIEALKSGHKVAREGWNGKGMWLAYMPPVTIPEALVNGRTKKFVPTGDLIVGGYIVAMTAQGVWQPGWTPWAPDVLAEDWTIVALLF